MATRRRPRPRHDPLVGGARRDRSAAVRHDGDRRSSREPGAIEGSLTVIADACAAVGVRLITCLWRHRPVGRRRPLVDSDWASPPPRMTAGARRGLAECERFIRAGGTGMVGVHAAFTCSDETIEAAAGLAADLGVGVHVHVAEGADRSRSRPSVSARYATDDWLLVHCVHLDRDFPARSPTTPVRT